MERHAALALSATLLAAVLATAAPSQAQSWMDHQWLLRRAVEITNPGGAALTAFQVHVALDSSFDFAGARSDGGDLRVTADDGTTLLPFWLERWDPSSRRADLWVKLASLPAAGDSVFLYYGNAAATSVSSGNATFDFFDDFSSSVTTPGYFAVSDTHTVLVLDQAWEGTEAPHTLSAIRAPAGAPWRWYGYYGLVVCGGIGMAGSNDLVHWTKFATNPLFSSGGERWPSVILDNGTYYMVHDEDYCGSSYTVLRTSTDGVTWSPFSVVVPPVVGQRNQNPSLFKDPVSGQFYLYWFNGDFGTYWNIMARSASTVAGLATAPDQQLLTANFVLAAPNVLYRDGVYYLSTETLDTVWKTRIYSGTSPTGPFNLIPGNPVLGGGTACMFQTPVDTTLYCYTCQLTDTVWTVAVRTADLNAPRQQFSTLDPGRWVVNGGDWTTLTATQPDGASGMVGQGSLTSRQLTRSVYSGTDYVLEGWGREVSGRIWGFGIRGSEVADTYTLNLYEDLDGTDNLYLYRWVAGVATTVWSGPVGTINPNQWYKLGVKAHGSSFDLYFDDVLQTTVTDAQYASGPVGLYGESGTVAQFDDVRVRKYAAVEPASAVGPAQMNPPVISALQAMPSPLGTMATVTWTTDRPATSLVTYGLLPGALDSTAVSPGLVTAHAVALPGLAPGTTYDFRVASTADSATAWAPALASPPASFTTPSVGVIAASSAGGACVVPGGCVGIPVRFARADTTPVRAYRVRVRLSADLSSCGAQFVSDTLLSHVGPASFRFTSLGGGAFEVADSLQGTLCGATQSGTLFRVYVGTLATSGSGTVTVDSVAVWGCGDTPLAVGTGPVATVPIVNGTPVATTGLTAVRVLPGGGTAGRTGIRVTYAAPSDSSRVEVYRRNFGNYPEYDGGTTPGSVPSAPSGYPPGGWTLTPVHASGDVDLPPTRDVWYFVAYSVDSCGGATPSAITGGTLDYVLGDVDDGVQGCRGDDQVTDADLDFLAAHYGATLAPGDSLAWLDVGPTTTDWVDGRPLTDGRVDFEDLALFAADYGLAGPGDPARPASGMGSDSYPMAVATGPIPDVDSTFVVDVSFRGAGDVQTLRVVLAYDTLVAVPVSVVPGDLIAAQSAPARVLSPAPGVIDVAVFGRGKGLSGTGDLATITFRMIAVGDPSVHLGSYIARDLGNRTISLDQVAGVETQPPPKQLMLSPGFPNPFRGSTTIAFGLPTQGGASLSVFDVQGRTVRRLLDGAVPAGWTRVTWDGRADDGRSLPAGVYLVRLAVNGRAATRSVLLLR